MKKLVFCTLLLLLIFFTGACSKGDRKIDVDEVTESTLLAKTNGEIQVATVEEFDKTYYSLSGLQDYIGEEIAAYNKKLGENKITVDSVKVVDNKAIMLLTYTGMDQYTAFNDVKAAYFNGGIKDIPLELPATLINAKDQSLVSTQETIQSEGYRILVLYEPYRIVVDGKVKFYSDKAKLIDENEVQSAAEGMTIVVYKP